MSKKDKEKMETEAAPDPRAIFRFICHVSNRMDSSVLLFVLLLLLLLEVYS